MGKKNTNKFLISARKKAPKIKIKYTQKWTHETVELLNKLKW